MTRLRWRIACWLVGPFVTIPDRNGVWIVQRFEGGWSVTTEADTFRMKLTSRVPSFDKPFDYDAPVTTGRFVGTVKR